jgi:hypothetical protein
MIQPQNDFLDVTVNQNQIIMLDDSTSNIASNEEPGLTVSMVAVNA